MSAPRLLAIAPPDWSARRQFAQQIATMAQIARPLGDQAGLYLRAHGWSLRQWLSTLSSLERPANLRIGITCPADLSLPDHAEDLSAAGVSFLHLTERDADRPLGPALSAPVQVSRVCHDPGDARRRLLLGADWLVVSPVFSTPSKPDHTPLGLHKLAAAARSAPGRVVALGGIDRSNLSECLSSGAVGVAVLRAAWDDPDELAACVAMLDGTAPLDDDTGA